MLRLFVFLCLAVTCCFAAEGHQFCCSAEDRHIVEEQWEHLWGDTESSKIKIQFGRIILLKLAEAHPDVKPLFANVDIEHPEGGKFSAHTFRILNALDLAINLLDDPESLDEALNHLADQHKVRAGVKKVHFQKIGEILHESLAHVLNEYNSLSWKSCFKGILGKIASKLHD